DRRRLTALNNVSRENFITQPTGNSNRDKVIVEQEGKESLFTKEQYQQILGMLNKDVSCDQK
ncbi:hypothetical protein HAX54_008137, partial [Datura stramonium]|nr:hypothetical protein [Datura stramonium]